jgi:protein SSD1
MVVLFNVRSSAKLSYVEAQDAINGHNLGDVVVASEHSASAIEQDVRTLNGLAKQLRAKRFQDGAMNLSSTRLKFTLDESGHPVDCEQTENSDANNMVEEVCV